MPSLPRWTPAGPDEDGVVAVVGDDLLQVLGAQRLRVVVDDLLRALRRCHPAASSPYRRGRPDLLISTEDKAARKGRSLAADVGRRKLTHEAGTLPDP
jgi:hypothetical protein